MEVTEKQLQQMIQVQVKKAVADSHPGNVPGELAAFKREVTDFAKHVSEGTPVRYDSLSQAFNSIIRTKLKLKRINDLPVSQIEEAREIFKSIQQVF